MGRRDESRAERRERVLGAARRLITSGGVASLTMRGLAAESGVAVNTIYALLGRSRENVLEALVEDGLADLDRMIHEKDVEDPLELGPAFATVVVDYVIERAEVYRPVFLAERQAARAGQGRWGDLRALRMSAEILKSAAAEGLLDDDLDLDLLGQHVFEAFRGLAVRWANEEIDAAGFRARFLYAVHLALLAGSSDRARPGFRALLREAERALGARPRRRRRKQRGGA